MEDDDGYQSQASVWTCTRVVHAYHTPATPHTQHAYAHASRAHTHTHVHAHIYTGKGKRKKILWRFKIPMTFFTEVEKKKS